MISATKKVLDDIQLMTIKRVAAKNAKDVQGILEKKMNEIDLIIKIPMSMRIINTNNTWIMSQTESTIINPNMKLKLDTVSDSIIFPNATNKQERSIKMPKIEKKKFKGINPICIKTTKMKPFRPITNSLSENCDKMKFFYIITGIEAMTKFLKKRKTLIMKIIKKYNKGYFDTKTI